MKQFSYSDGGEHYDGRFSTKEKAIQEAIKEFDLDAGDHVEIGENTEPNVKNFLPGGDDILELLTNNAAESEEGGEWSEDFLGDITKEHEAELKIEMDAVIIKWMKKYGHLPKWFMVYKHETVTITKEMIDHG